MFVLVMQRLREHVEDDPEGEECEQLEHQAVVTVEEEREEKQEEVTAQLLSKSSRRGVFASSW